MLNEDMVELKDDKLIVRVISTGKNELEQLQTARRLSRRAFAKYVKQKYDLEKSLSELLELARDTESLLDAEIRVSAMIYTVSFPVPKGR